MTITDKADFKAKVRASMCQLQNDPEKIRTKNYRSNMPPDSAFTYGLINSDDGKNGSERPLDHCSLPLGYNIPLARAGSNPTPIRCGCGIPGSCFVALSFGVSAYPSSACEASGG